MTAGERGAAVAGYVAEYYSPQVGRVLCYGYGETEAQTRRNACAQFAGTSLSWQSHMRRNIKLRAVDADEASEICEMLTTPWF